MGFDRWRQARDEPKELDLIPIMNLMVTLIPFLMLGAAFYHIGVIPTSLPAEASQAAAADADAIVTINLQIENDGALQIGATSPTLPPETLAGLAAVLPRGDSGPDLAGLTRHLAGVKARYPKSDTLLLLPAPAVAYQTLIDVLDAAREQAAADGSPPTILFPVAVFSKKLTAPEADAGVEGAEPLAPPGDQAPGDAPAPAAPEAP